MDINLKIIIGSTRPGRKGPIIARWVEEAAKASGLFKVELVDLAEMNLPLLDESSHPAMQKYEHEHTKRWASIIGSADAYIFVTPEYDFFAPASLVNAIQVLMKEWGYKAAGVVSYGGISGGLRSTQVLRGLLGNMNVHALPQSVPMPMVFQMIDENDKLQPTQIIADGTKLMLSELHKWSVALKPLRG